MVTLLAYCLMPNHVHLLARTGDVPLAKFMQGLQQSYTQWFNRRHERSGMCSRVDTAPRLRLRRVPSHPGSLHPPQPRAGRPGGGPRIPVQRAPDLSGRRRHRGAGPRALLDRLGGREAYGRFVHDALAEQHQAHLYQVQAQQVLGDAAFAAAVAGQRPLHAPRDPPLALNEALGRLASSCRSRWSAPRPRPEPRGVWTRALAGVRAGAPARLPTDRRRPAARARPAAGLGTAVCRLGAAARP